jgi:hypothetical protein
MMTKVAASGQPMALWLFQAVVAHRGDHQWARPTRVPSLVAIKARWLQAEEEECTWP